MAKAPKPENAKDPRYRPFRVAMYTIYIALCGVFSVLITVSVIRSVGEMTPPRTSDPTVTLSVKECVQGAEKLWDELDAQRKALTQNRPAASADDNWTGFRVNWLHELRNLEARCATASHARAPLVPVFKNLEQVMDRYTTHAVQYAGEVGSAVDAVRDSLDTARQALPVGKLP
ncbi:MAG: hypothetical protein ACT4TC_18000 [Myxococcaceae bacterium]